MKEEIICYVGSLEIRKKGKEIILILCEEEGDYRDDPFPRKFKVSIPLTSWKLEEINN